MNEQTFQLRIDRAALFTWSIRTGVALLLVFLACLAGGNLVPFVIFAGAVAAYTCIFGFGKLWSNTFDEKEVDLWHKLQAGKLDNEDKALIFIMIPLLYFACGGLCGLITGAIINHGLNAPEAVYVGTGIVAAYLWPLFILAPVWFWRWSQQAGEKWACQKSDD